MPTGSRTLLLRMLGSALLLKFKGVPFEPRRLRLVEQFLRLLLMLSVLRLLVGRVLLIGNLLGEQVTLVRGMIVRIRRLKGSWRALKTKPREHQWSI